MRRFAILAVTISCLLPAGCERKDLGDAPGSYTFDEAATRAAFDEALGSFSEGLSGAGYALEENGSKVLWHQVSRSALQCELGDDGSCSLAEGHGRGRHTWRGSWSIKGDQVRLDMNDQKKRWATYVDGTLVFIERAFNGALKMKVILRRQ